MYVSGFEFVYLFSRIIGKLVYVNGFYVAFRDFLIFFFFFQETFSKPPAIGLENNKGIQISGNFCEALHN